ncbi:hypothetical protein GHNINEIG_00206 [Hydrogenovibrio crunogenus]|uniref:Uncharacterized protein n=1 Tax=Hydrogenovibrio crunogenus TaxID=39765 RepID=A0A4P7NZ31_9GAMM|nr:hypothetical protein [Hydrogenovibrio crunogenus]QBZ82182.1 hypothetical protein GHNINEIG_00206 [Hydrogenovibrio crunogenus]
MNELAVLIGIILFPGFISAITAEKITSHVKPWGALKYGIYSFVLGVMSYAVIQAVILIWQVIFENPVQYYYLSVWSFIFDPSLKFELADVFWATMIAIPLGILAAAIVYHKRLNRIAKFFNASFKYGDENLFSYFLSAEDTDWIYVRDKEKGLTYQGRVVSYSENESFQELVMMDVTVFGYDDSEEYYSVPKLYLSKKLGGFSIESIPNELLE